MDNVEDFFLWRIVHTNILTVIMQVGSINSDIPHIWCRYLGCIIVNWNLSLLFRDVLTVVCIVAGDEFFYCRVILASILYN